MNLPNLLTLTRILLIPVFVIFIIDESYWYALITFAIAGITDGIDGLIARLTHSRTELGAYLDPIADKMLLSSGFVALAIAEILPSWVTVIVITRDVIILMGIFLMILINRRPNIRPSFVSKLTTAFQISTVLLALLKMYYPFFDLFSTLAIYGTSAFTITSGIHYIYIGTRFLNQKKPPQVA